MNQDIIGCGVKVTVYLKKEKGIQAIVTLKVEKITLSGNVNCSHAREVVGGRRFSVLFPCLSFYCASKSGNWTARIVSQSHCPLCLVFPLPNSETFTAQQLIRFVKTRISGTVDCRVDRCTEI